MKVVLVAKGEHSSSKIRFASCFVRNQSASLKAEGIDVYEYCILGSGLKNIVRLRKLIKDNNVDVVHAQYGSTTAMISLLACWKLTPFVVSFCGSDLWPSLSCSLKNKIRAIVVRLFSRTVAKFADRIVVKSSGLYRLLPTKVQKITTIQSNGVNTDFFVPIDKIEARNELKLDHKKKFVLFNKSYETSRTVKNIKLAHNVMDILQKEKEDVELLEIANLSFEQMPIYLNAVDALLLTSLFEGSPNIVKEAMSCNLPIVTVNCGDVQERLKEVTPGAIEDYDPFQLAQSLKRVINEGVRSNGRKALLEQGYDNKSVAKKIIEIYKRIIK